LRLASARAKRHDTFSKSSDCILGRLALGYLRSSARLEGGLALGLGRLAAFITWGGFYYPTVLWRL
jgi:hypothetical protein